MQNQNRNTEAATHLTSEEARSGSRTRVTRNILLISLTLVVLLLVIALGTGFFETSRTGADAVNADNSAQSIQN